jgi:hypothetical protein
MPLSPRTPARSIWPSANAAKAPSSPPPKGTCWTGTALGGLSAGAWAMHGSGQAWLVRKLQLATP